MKKKVQFKNFTADEHKTWHVLYESLRELRTRFIVPEFQEGLHLLHIGSERIPDLDEVNKALTARSGFRAVPVEGYEETDQFFEYLARREFPIGNFIRDKQQLSYTPAPDVFHDLYGHVPFLAWREYADFCAEFGKLATRFKNKPNLFRQCDRLFWFGTEFGLLQGPNGRLIFGAGIASSFAECHYALSPKPEVRLFDLNQIRHQEFKIDEMQPLLFLLQSPQQLFSCLPEFERLLTSEQGADL